MTGPKTTALLALSLLLPAAGARAADAEPAWAEPPVERLVRIVEPKGGAEVSLDELIAKLAKADAVFLGETHLDETTHRFEQEVYRRLIEARKGKVVLAMEMFSRDVQGALDAYLAGEIDEAEFLENSRPWQNYRTGYRLLIEMAKAKGLPVVASNAARSAQRAVAMGGEEAYQGLSEEDRAGVASELHAPTDEYWRRVENATRGHRGMLPSGGARKYATQSLWDNTMGESVALALKEHPGWLVLHVNGAFHSDWWRGTVRQLKLRAPKAKVVTVDVSAMRQPSSIDEDRLTPSSDWAVFAASRARDRNEGFFGVSVGGEMRYVLHVPKGASSGDSLPLLVWLPDDGPGAADELALWRRRLGDEAIVAVVEQRWREQQEDLSSGGRWTWPGDFHQDIPGAGAAVERIQAYLLRYYPIDPARVVVAGEGVGATVAVAADLYGDRWAGQALALAPRKHGELRDLPLPLPEDRVGPPPARSLTVFAPAADREWWDQETADYREVGFEAGVEDWSADPWRRLDRVESAVRSALGLKAPPLAESAPRAHVVLEHDTPLARNWARRLAAAESAREGAAVAVLTRSELGSLDAGLEGSRELPVRMVAELFSSGRARLPHANGPFGGTTLVVLGDDLSPAELEAWAKLEADDPINAGSRFHRLRTARLSGERSLDAVLAELKSQRRTNVLVVPAEFAAAPAQMRAIRDAARAHEDDMTIEYRPGLGSALASAGDEQEEKGDG